MVTNVSCGYFKEKEIEGVVKERKKMIKREGERKEKGERRGRGRDGERVCVRERERERGRKGGSMAAELMVVVI